MELLAVSGCAAGGAKVEGKIGVVDPARVRFWEGWGCIKWAIICLMKGQSQRNVEAFAIGRRMEEPLYDFLEFLDTI